MVIVLDCGTTNTKIYGVTEGVCVGEKYIKMGVRDVAVGIGREELKAEIRKAIGVLAEENVGKKVRRIIAYGMLTSESGFRELPHTIAPAGLEDLRNCVETVYDPAIWEGVPITYIRGIKNSVDSALPPTEAVSRFDFMRGEETQTMGAIRLGCCKPPFHMVVLSSHTKFVHIDADGRITGSCTTMSGQYYEAVREHSIIGKSLQRTEESNWSLDAIIDCAGRCCRDGFTRATMIPRFMEVMGGFTGADRDNFFQTLIIWEDMALLDFMEEQGEDTKLPYVVIGQKERCELFVRILQKKLGAEVKTIVLSDREAIRDLSVAGALAIAD